MIEASCAVLALGGAGPLALLRPGALAAAGLTRASKGWVNDAAGLWSEAAPNAARFRGPAARLLVEGARTNLAAGSLPGGGSWGNVGLGSVTAVADPAGGTGANALAEDSATGTHRSGVAFAATSGTTYSFSVFARAGTLGLFQLLFSSAAFSLQAYATFDLANGVAGSVGSAATAAIAAVGGGWYRCSLTATATASSTPSAIIYLADAAASARAPSYLGSGRRVQFWQAMVEAGAFASTPVTTAGATATRAADVPAWIAPAGFATRGTLLLKAMLPQAGAAQGLLMLSDGSNANRLALLASGTALAPLVVAGGATLATAPGLGSIAPGTAFTAGIAYDPGGVVMQGPSGGPQAVTGTLPAGLGQVTIGHASADLLQAAFGEFESVVALPYRASNAELAARLAAM
jgi:hypothetical protein